MSRDGGSSGLMRTVIVSAVTAVVVVILLAVVGLGVYYLAFRDAGEASTIAGGESIGDKIERAGRTIRGSTTDAGKITSVSFSAWSHAGLLYPGPKDPPGYVESSSVEFRRDLTAVREKKKDYDRDLPDEISKFSTSLTAEQFAKLAEVCAQNDIVNEPNATNNRSEAGTTLTIDYSGEKKSITTSNMGQNSAQVASVLAAIRQLENTVMWSSVP